MGRCPPYENQSIKYMIPTGRTNKKNTAATFAKASGEEEPVVHVEALTVGGGVHFPNDRCELLTTPDNERPPQAASAGTLLA
jgi:hypothetical protein